MKRKAALATLLVAAALGATASLAAAQDDSRVPLVRVPFPQDERNLTPYTFELGYPLMTLVYDTLMWRDARGVPRPWLARSVRRSSDGRTISIRLHRGVRWQDGRPLTADDVAFTFAFVRERPHPRFTPELRAVDSVQAVAPDRVLIRLRHPSLGFLDQPLSDLPILPRHIWEGLPPDRLAPAGLPVGSGPYRLVRHVRGGLYIFRANDRYFRGGPAVATIAVPIIRRAADMTLALERRRVDALPVPLDSTAAAQFDDVGERIVDTPSYVGTVLMFNTRRAPFNDPDARRAVADALDLSRIADALSRSAGERAAVAADRGYLHPSSPWAPQRAIERFDPVRARVALAELGLPTIRVLAPSGDATRLEAGRQVVLALRRAGARARVVEQTPRQLARAVGQNGATPTFQAAVWSSPALASYDPDYLPVVFGDRGAAPLNYSGYSSPAFERLANRVSSAPERRRRRAAVEAELTRLAADVPVVPLFFLRGRFAYRPAVHDGWVAVRGAGILDKQSFLRAGAPEPRGETDNPLAAPASGSGFELNAFGIAALALLGLAAGALLANVLPRLRRR